MRQSAAMSSASPAMAPPAGLSAGRRLLLTFTSPLRVFEDVARRPTFVLALVLLSLVAMASAAVTLAKVDSTSAIRAAMAKQPNMSEEQVDKAVETMGKLKWIGLGIAPIAAPAAMAIIATIFWLGAKLLGSGEGWPAVFSGVLHASFPAAVTSSAMIALVMLSRGTIPAEHADHLLKSSIGSLMPESVPKAVVALLDAVDVFSIWTAVLLTLAVAVTARLKVRRAAMLVGGSWAVWIVLKVAGALIATLMKG